jgi:cytochrome c556
MMAAAIAFAGGAIAAGAPADTIKARQQALKDTGAAFKTIRDQMKSGSPDAAAIKTAAQTIKKTSVAMVDWFPKGTGTEAGVKTAAKPEIWSDAAGFETARKNFVEQADKFAALADAGDMAAVGGGIRPLGMACGGCHDKFRVKED